jgi:hypothetical protein
MNWKTAVSINRAARKSIRENKRVRKGREAMFVSAQVEVVFQTSG